MSTKKEGQKKHILELLTKLKKGQATEADVREIDLWYDNPTSTAKYTDGMSYAAKGNAKEKMFRNINDRISTEIPSTHQRISYKLLSTISIAAVFLLVIGAGLYYLMPGIRQHRDDREMAKMHSKSSSDKALLTLANGKQIMLSGAKNGILAKQGNTIINKTDDGKLVYHEGPSEAGQTHYNTMTTLRGGEYHLTLSDGTNVWLNAASSIKYPATFSGKNREVEIKGEAYFEVAHDAAHPFRVITKNQTIEVLGTHFNINAYDNEARTKTTLLQGSVRISANGKFQLLRPGQQAAVTKDNNIELSKVDMQEVVAWKDGFFEFTDADIETIMRQISRWYDVEVIYEGKITNETFSGRVSKFLTIKQVLTMVQSPNVHIKYEKGRIMVKK